MATCPNKSSEDWKLLVASRGEDIAHYLWDVYEGNVPESESRESIVKAGLKAVNILLYKESFDLFQKGKKNNWSLEKILTELQIPKEQKQLIINNGNTEWNDIVSDLVANYSYAIEINTSKEKVTQYGEYFNFSYNGDSYLSIPEVDRYEKNGKEITKKEFNKVKQLANNTILPTQIYSNLTVPGGTNYTENEIATPAITPSIKGHAQFATDKGIGWFRSDDKTVSRNVEIGTGFKKGFLREEELQELQDMGYTVEETQELAKQRYSEISTASQLTKTRRILEVQSDLFQKGRDKEDLIGNYEAVEDVKVESKPFIEKLNSLNNGSDIVITSSGNNINEYYKKDNIWFRGKNTGQSKNSTSNQFLQLLNQGSNWVTFFVKSIIQDSSKKGYEKVLFPSGNTASKVEGHTTLEEFKKQKEDRIDKLSKELIPLNKLQIVKSSSNTFQIRDNSGYTAEARYNLNKDFDTIEKAQKAIYDVEGSIELEINQLKQELERVEGPEGFGALKPIYNFYENTVKNVLNKQYGKDNVKQVTDEYGNTWNEVEIVPEREQKAILLQKETKELPSSKASEETLNKVKALIAKMGVKIQDLQDYLKGNPDINATDVNGLADLVRGIIAIAEGKEDVALTEEMVHIATAIIEKLDPKFVTEMISKIDRFAIYKKVLNAYKDDKNYQLPNGKPDIRKIKKEAVDKLIVELIINQSQGSTEFPELMEELPRTMIQKIWNAILDFFSGRYRKANIDIFTEASERILEGEIGDVETISDMEEIFLQKKSPKMSDKQKELQELILDTKDRIKKRESKEKVDPLLADSEEASNYYVELETTGNERKITKRVTDRVKTWYEQRFGKNKKFTKEEEFINDFKRDHGIKYHFYFEDIHNRYFKEDGTRRETPLSRTIDIVGPNEEVYERLEQYYVDLVKKFSEGKKNPLVFSEVVVYDPKEQEAGTIDLLIIEENGKANIFDWKFMTVSATAEDVAWYKQGAYNIQLGRYKDILRESYGVKEFGQMRAIPILMDVKRKNWRNPDSDLIVKGIEIGSVNVSKIKDFTLVPVSEETESTGNEELDEAITQLNAILKQVGKEGVTNEDEKKFKSERMNALSKAIRAAQSANNLVPLIQVIKLMRKEGQNLVNDWETIYNKKAASADDINDAQLSEYADSLREYMAISQVFGSMNDLIGNLIYDKSEIKNAKTDAQKEDLAKRKTYLESIDNEAKLIRLSSKKVEVITGKFADKFMGERNLVQGLLSPQAVWSGIGSFFRGASEVPLPSVSILFKLVTNAKGRARRDALKEVEELMSIRKRITDKGGDVRKYIQQLYQKDDKNKLVNKIIYKYKKEFTDLVDKNASEEFPSKEWLYNNLDREGYQKEANEVLEKRIERLKRIYSEDKEMMNKLILQEKRMFDVTRNDFTGWNNYIVKRHPLRSIDKNGIESSPWLSDEYKNIQNDKELLDLYNFLIKTNKKASDVGYLENKIHSTFLPFVRKSMAESLAWDFSLSSIMNFGNGLSLQADDIGFGDVNELTGEIEHSIPKYYTSDFSMKQDEAGNTIHDYTDVSEDLFKNMILYINHMHNYKYLSEVEGQAQLIKTVESFKKHLATTRSGDVIIKPNGDPEELKGNEQNTKIFDDFLRALLYEQKYPLSDTDTSISTGLVKQIKKIVNSVAGKEVFTDLDKPSATSLFKSMDALNRTFQLKTLGLDIVSGAVNLFGANIQIATQAGNYFTKWDYFKNFNGLIGSRFKDNDDRKMFLKLIDTFMPLKDDPTYDKLKEAGLSKITQQNFSDWLMVFMREPEQHVEKSIFLTLLDNSMIVDGKIVNIREFVKAKYKDRWNSASDYADSSKKIEDEIKELKSTSSITNTMKLENDELVIPGLDLNNFKEIDRVTKLSRRISRNAVGGMSDSDINRMSMSVWGRSMMVFKNWIPKLVDTRFGELRKISDDFSTTIDENGLTEGEKYDIGRVRLWWGVLTSSISDRSLNILNILQVNDKGILLLDKMYLEYKAAYEKRTGEKFTMTKEDFNEMIRTNLRNQVQELTMLLVLFGLKLSMGMLPPDDDKDKATKNFFRYSQRVVDKFVGELSFFYNPLEAEHLLSGSMFPAIGVFSDVIKFISHFSSQALGFEIFDPTLSSEEVRKKAQPVKYLAKMLPVTKSLMTYGAIFNDDFAKEFDITIQKDNVK
jgi:hypothetical protein